jgi:hypothetical protein
LLLSKYWKPNIIDPNRPEQEINDDLSFLLVRISSLMQFLESNLANLESGLTFKRKNVKLISKQSKESKERLTLFLILSDRTMKTE